MELEFDKEIDAILRRAAREPAASTSSSVHLDPDAIAAFAENALPATARSLYTSHLADCERCRKIFAQTIALGSEADEKPASTSVKAPVVPSEITWYQKLFVTRNLVAAMGALFVVVFGGLLAYVVVDRGRERQGDVSQLSRPDAANKPAVYAEATPAEAPSSSNASTNSASSAVTSGTSPLTKTLGQEDQNQPVIGGAAEPMPPPAKETDQPAPSAATPASPPVIREEPPKTEADESKVAAEKKLERKADDKAPDGVDLLARGRADSKDTALRNSTAQNNSGAGVYKSKSGPYRDQQRNVQTQTPTADESPNDRRYAAKSVGGRYFVKRDGVWYDNGFNGQPTIDIHRGTAQYKLLDPGLRSIAQNLSGVIVVIWKNRAYRIQ
jgi:hypothetical protein